MRHQLFCKHRAIAALLRDSNLCHAREAGNRASGGDAQGRQARLWPLRPSRTSASTQEDHRRHRRRRHHASDENRVARTRLARRLGAARLFRDTRACATPAKPARRLRQASADTRPPAATASPAAVAPSAALAFCRSASTASALVSAASSDVTIAEGFCFSSAASTASATLAGL